MWPSPSIAGCTCAGLLINALYYVLLHINDLEALKQLRDVHGSEHAMMAWTIRLPQSDGNGGRLRLRKLPAWICHETHGWSLQFSLGDSAASGACLTAPYAYHCPPTNTVLLPASKMVSDFTLGLQNYTNSCSDFCNRPDVQVAFCSSAGAVSAGHVAPWRVPGNPGGGIASGHPLVPLECAGGALGRQSVDCSWF